VDDFFIFVKRQITSKMKKHIALLFIVLSTTITLAQKKEKIKGSKNVTIEQREINNFITLEVDDNIEVHLEKGEKPMLQVEADDNLHDIIAIDYRDKTLRLYTSKEASRYRKLSVKITYTSELATIISKNEAEINAIQEIQSDSLNVQALDYSKVFMNANATYFSLDANDKSKIELNLKSSKAKIVLSKDASLKTLITATDLSCDLYQKSDARIEGDIMNATFRLDNNSKLIASKLIVKNTTIKTEGYASAEINTDTTVAIEASNKSEINIYGNAKIDLVKFTDEAKLFKKIK
jgi:hypothetical protein